MIETGVFQLQSTEFKYLNLLVPKKILNLSTNFIFLMGSTYIHVLTAAGQKHTTEGMASEVPCGYLWQQEKFSVF